MKNSSAFRALPSWALPVTLIVAVCTLGLLGWRAITSSSDYAGPPKQVHAGQYDLKAEVMKMRAARENNATSH